MKSEALLVALMAVLWAGNLALADEAVDIQLRAEEQNIDVNKSELTDTQKTEILAKEYHVSAHTIQNLRDKGQGWGEISIGLATARELEKTNRTTYPTLEGRTDGSSESLRASGEGWGKIAHTLGFKLGPVISSAHHFRHELREGIHRERVEDRSHHEEVSEHEAIHHETIETSGRPEHLEHSGIALSDPGR